MNLRGLRRHWDALGRADPLWAVLTHPNKKGQRWGVEEFFRTGEQEIAAVLAQAESLGLRLASGRALDFGCGVGRLTRALASRFDEVVGVDIAPSMLERARSYHQDLGNCRFVLNEGKALAELPAGSFDFIYTSIVLQHIPPRYARGYLSSFVRLLGDEGVLIFQLPSHKNPEPAGTGTKARIRRLVPSWVLGAYRLARSLGEFPRMEGHGMAPSEVRRTLEDAGGRVVEVLADGSAGPQWVSHRYFARRDPLRRRAE